MATSGIGSALGGVAGGLIGTAVGGPMGTAIGAGLGSAAGIALESIPTLIKTDAEKENERRLAELQRMQEMGTLGLSESEKQQIFTSQQQAAGSQLKAAGQAIRASGAAFGAGGAGAEQLRQAAAAEAMAGAQARIAQNVEAQNLQRKRELEQEIQARIAAKSQSEQEALAAGVGIASTGLNTFIQAYGQEQLMQGRMPTGAETAALAKMYGVDENTASGLLSYLAKNPEAASVFSKYGNLAKPSGG